MRLPKTILLVYTDGTVKKFDATSTLVMEKLQEVLSFHDSIQKSDPPFNESYRESFYKLVSALGYNDSIKYTPDRERALKARLKSFTIEELFDAASGIRLDAFLQGDNKSSKRYGTIDYLLRSDKNVDTYRQLDSVKQYGIDLTALEL